MTDDNTGPDDNPNLDDNTDPRVARREKMRRIEELGHDPFGSRFDDRTLIGQCQARADEIKWTKEDGTEVPMPDFDDES